MFPITSYCRACCHSWRFAATAPWAAALLVLGAAGCGWAPARCGAGPGAGWAPACLSPPLDVSVSPGGELLPPIQATPQNTTFVPQTNRDAVWDQVVDVVDDYFRIEREQRVRLVGNVLTEGRIDTFPQDGATVFEPHLRDSVGRYNRWESTLQTIRRQATVRVIPAEGGYIVEVSVEKELEDLPKPERATAGAATFRSDTGLRSDTRLEQASHEKAPRRWIPKGRDVALEQTMLSAINARLGSMSQQYPAW